MPIFTTKPMTVRTSDEVKDAFKLAFKESGETSQNDFINKLIQKWNAPETGYNSAIEAEIFETPPTPEETQEILKSSFEKSEANTMEEFLDNLLQKWTKPEKLNEPEPELANTEIELLPNEIRISLNYAQEYALRETVLSRRFAEYQNDILNEKLKGDFYSGDLSTTTEFKELCVKNIILTDDMTPEEKESGILHNMGALLINRFLERLVHGDLYSKGLTTLRKKDLKDYIQKHPQELPFEFSVKINITDLQNKDLILSLSPVKIYAMRETVLCKDNFAEEQNEITDSLIPGNRPFFYFGNLFEPEFQLLWVKNIVLTDDMNSEQKESAILHNMSAFLMNMFLTNFVEENISFGTVKSEALKTLIQEHDQDFLLTDKEAANQ